MNNVKQGYLAFSTLVLVILLTVSIMYFVDYAFMESWLVLGFILCVPFQVAGGMLLDANKPQWLGSLTVPVKGGLVIVGCAIGAVIFSLFVFYTVGGGINLPKPPVINYAIAVVVVTFWYAIIWQCWPVTKFNPKPEWLAASVIVVGFGLGYVLFTFAFNFEFMQGSHLYVEALDPKGWFTSWNVVAFMVTTVAVIFTVVLFDFWPFTQFKSMERALIANAIKSVTVVAIAVPIYTVFVHVVNIDPVIYLVNGPISYIFGMFVPLNLFAGQLFSHVKQPHRGFYLVLVSIVSGCLLNVLYFWLAHNMLPDALLGQLYQQELWVANAMLAFSFPLLVAFTTHLNFWPLSLLSKNKKQATSLCYENTEQTAVK